MFSGKYTSSKVVIERLYSDYPFERRMNIYDVFQWIGEVFGLVGVNAHYRKITTGMDADNPTIKISNYQGLLPCGLREVLAVKDFVTGVVLRESTDKFHMLKTASTDLSASGDATYMLNDNYIRTSFENGELAMTYTSYPIDKDGWLMIPDEPRFLKASIEYVAWMIAKKLYIAGEMTRDKVDYLEAECDWWMGAARSKGIMPSMDMMESIKNSMMRLNPKINQHSAGFVFMGQQEQLYIK